MGCLKENLLPLRQKSKTSWLDFVYYVKESYKNVIWSGWSTVHQILPYISLLPKIHQCKQTKVRKSLNDNRVTFKIILQSNILFHILVK